VCGTVVVQVLDEHERRLPARNAPRRRITIASYNREACRDFFRFYPEELNELLPLLRLQPVVTSGGNRFTTEEGMLVLLARLAVPKRWSDHLQMFGGTEGLLSEVFNAILGQIYHTFADPLLHNLQRYGDQFEKYAALTYARGGATGNVVGYVDNTNRKMCRPGVNQDVVYNGYKKFHALKYQIVMGPEGVIIALHGPDVGRDPDVTCLVNSGLLDDMADVCATLGQHYVFYADRGYPLDPHMLVAFTGPALTAAQLAWNAAMNRERTSEWGYGKPLALWGMLNLATQQKLLLMPIAQHYMVAIILTNCHTACYGSVVTSYFDSTPPSLESYMDIGP
jgi:nuclease HARBI1